MSEGTNLRSRQLPPRSQPPAVSQSGIRPATMDAGGSQPTPSNQRQQLGPDLQPNLPPLLQPPDRSVSPASGQIQTALGVGITHPLSPRGQGTHPGNGTSGVAEGSSSSPASASNPDLQMIREEVLNMLNQQEQRVFSRCTSQIVPHHLDLETRLMLHHQQALDRLFFQDLKMPRSRDDPPAVLVYTICDESKYLIVRNVPALGCGEELSKLFGSYGEIEECKPMDAEDCEPFTDVYLVKYSQVNNARFAKRKLDESIFIGNKLHVSYAPDFESLSDAQDKLERRRIEVISRIKFPRTGGSKSHMTSKREQKDWCREHKLNHVSSNQDYFPISSMNETVKFVRSKLDKVQSSSDHVESPLLKKTRLDNRRRI